MACCDLCRINKGKNMALRGRPKLSIGDFHQLTTITIYMPYVMLKGGGCGNHETSLDCYHLHWFKHILNHLTPNHLTPNHLTPNHLIRYDLAQQYPVHIPCAAECFDISLPPRRLIPRIWLHCVAKCFNFSLRPRHLVPYILAQRTL